MALRLPSRYEDLDDAFRGRLSPNAEWLALIKRSFASMEVNGGIRFIPIFGESGSGKSSAALEVGSHLPEIRVIRLDRQRIESADSLITEIRLGLVLKPKRYLLYVIDQYEEVAAEREDLPRRFVEQLALLDRGELRSEKILFAWLTTSREFQQQLSEATSRNKRILVAPGFEILGPPKATWPSIIAETFRFHNQERDLSDYQILDIDLEATADGNTTLGRAIEVVGERLYDSTHQLQDLSSYQVVMLWPVTDGLRITRIQQFTDARQGYKLDWNAWFRQLNMDDQKLLPVKEYNRARLYFDVRLVPIAAADLHPLCKELDNDNFKLHTSYLERFRNTHFYSIVSGRWSPEQFSPLRERPSQRADEARTWYESVTTQPTKLGKRLSRCINELGLPAEYERTITSATSQLRTDVLVNRTPVSPPNVIVELKAFSPENTMPSSICDSVRATLRRHAQFAGFLGRQ